MPKLLPKLTTKQSKTIANMVENGGNASKAMRDAGYSKSMSHNPQKLTKSENFQYWMERQGITDEKLSDVLKKGLEATKTIVMGKDEDSFVDIQPDYPTIHKYLETALKVKGIHQQETGTINLNFGVKSNTRKYIDAED